MFRNILVAFDGSPPAEEALEHAIDLAQAQGARLTLLTASPSYLDVASSVAPGGASLITSSAAAGGEPRIDLNQAQRQLEEDAKAVLDRGAARVPATLVSETVLATGAPAQKVLERVRQGQHDLVVMGSRGRTGIGAMLLGSVSHNVLHHSPVPVLIVPPHRDVEAPEKRGLGSEGVS